MRQINGDLSFTFDAEGRIAISTDGDTVAAFGPPEAGSDDDHLTVYVDTERWSIKGAVPALLASAVESNTAPSTTALTPLGLPEWPSRMAKDTDTLASAETGVSPITFAPAVSTIQSGDSTYTLTAGPRWKSWTLRHDGETAAVFDTSEGISARIDRPVPLPVIVLASATVIGVDSETQRPRFMTAKRREHKVEEKFVTKYAADFDAARQAGHDPQYMHAWDDRSDLYSWMECLTCGDAASTFANLGGSFVAGMGFGKALGKLKGPLLDEPCAGHRKI